MQSLPHYWQSVNLVSVLLWPLSVVYTGFATARYYAYQRGILKSSQLGVPVIVVGNITVGGTGKTPLVIYLAQLLKDNGYQPGIVSRGYGGNAQNWPRPVTALSDPREVGDEPVLLAHRCACPVMVGPDRVAAARELLITHKAACNVILADDGLQHYPLGRDIEIAVVDYNRGFANGACLPAGPLREPRGRLKQVSFVVEHGTNRSEHAMTLVGERAVNLMDSSVTCSLTGFRTTAVHAVAGIGDPSRFFNFLRSRGIRTIDHPFPDHHRFTATDLAFGDDLTVLMTEKDAVKCKHLARDSVWYIPVQARLDPLLEEQILKRLAQCVSKIPDKTPKSEH
jgi:tetraacyldisaccharide 4'-kinase